MVDLHDAYMESLDGGTKSAIAADVLPVDDVVRAVTNVSNV